MFISNINSSVRIVLYLLAICFPLMKAVMVFTYPSAPSWLFEINYGSLFASALVLSFVVFHRDDILTLSVEYKVSWLTSSLICLVILYSAFEIAVNLFSPTTGAVTVEQLAGTVLNLLLATALSVLWVILFVLLLVRISKGREHILFFSGIFLLIGLMFISGGVIQLLFGDNPRTVASLEPGSEFKDCDVCPTMVIIPPGSVEINSKILDEEDSTERSVKVFERKFAVGKFHITVGQYRKFVEESGYDPVLSCFIYEDRSLSGPTVPYNWSRPGYKQTDNHPVVCVDIRGVIAYINWLREKTQQPYILMDEAMWEYVARAGADNNDAPVKTLNTNGGLYLRWGRSIEALKSEKQSFTPPVGSTSPNAFQLYDIPGNVAEWTWDCVRGQKDEGAEGSGDSEICVATIIKGVAWTEGRAQFAISERILFDVDGSVSVLGFRVARLIN